jgi:oligo-1,6-glucosidase
MAIGGLKGITAKLDYLNRLGIDVVWLSRTSAAPMPKTANDLRDYNQVMAEFGTMTDFGRMLGAMKGHGIELIIDLVVSHTSDEHVWSANSRCSRDNPHREYYIWRDGKRDGAPPSNYPSVFRRLDLETRPDHRAVFTCTTST